MIKKINYARIHFNDIFIKISNQTNILLHCKYSHLLMDHLLGVVRLKNIFLLKRKSYLYTYQVRFILHLYNKHSRYRCMVVSPFMNARRVLLISESSGLTFKTNRISIFYWFNRCGCSEIDCLRTGVQYLNFYWR